MKDVQELLKSLFIIVAMGSVYMLVEILFKGSTYWEMGIVGGIAGFLVGLINKIFTWETPLILQGFIGMLIGTTVEFISGCILNLWLHLNIWSYSDLPFNLCGQICLYFMIAWYFLSFLGIFVDDYVRWLLFGETKPSYRIL